MKDYSVRRFWSRVEKKDGCWLWGGDRFNSGYGRYSQQLAHRLAYTLTKGPIGEGMFVCHRCDVPLCVNPDHLFVGTNSDNMRDCVRKGRHRGTPPSREKQTHCKRGHEMSGANLVGLNKQRCRTCRNENAKRRMAAYRDWQRTRAKTTTPQRAIAAA